MPIVPQPRLTVIDHGPKDFLTYPEYIATSKQQVSEGGRRVTWSQIVT